MKLVKNDQLHLAAPFPGRNDFPIRPGIVIQIIMGRDKLPGQSCLAYLPGAGQENNFVFKVFFYVGLKITFHQTIMK